ncbi:MAG: outer membrane beta-barrel protein [Bryobacter sp.]|nr:outer membrane beta-barrel protein [Bryobacter sp.]
MLLALTPVAKAQQITFNFVGGTALTKDLLTYEERSEQFYFRRGPGARSAILGASIEWAIKEALAFEAGFLHRSLRTRVLFEDFSPTSPGRAEDGFTAVRTWQFPLLLKYYLPEVKGLLPFLAAGPSFRTQEDAGGVAPSQSGISVGAGFTAGWKRLRIAPSLRYTRWRADGGFPRLPTKPDQLEFLTSIGLETNGATRRIAGRRIAFGLIGGFPLTSNLVELPQLFPRSAEDRFRYNIGLTVAVPLTDRWSLSFDAIYRPLRFGGDNPERRTEFSILTWQLPLLVRYRLPGSGWRPFAEAGPSFRLSGNLNSSNPSKFGGTVGGGLDKRWANGISFSPSFRYTRWRQDEARSFSRTNPNTAEILLGLRF